MANHSKIYSYMISEKAFDFDSLLIVGIYIFDFYYLEGAVSVTHLKVTDV